jgi:hypothetical protein
MVCFNPKDKSLVKQTSIVCLIIQRLDGKVLIGKHENGPFKNKWGIASLGAEQDRRPQDCAAKLAEVSSLGMLGRASFLVSRCKRKGKTMDGITVYSLLTELCELDALLSASSAYITRCFPKNGCPLGIVAWKKCKWIDCDEPHPNLDTFTRSALSFIALTHSHTAL